MIPFPFQMLFQKEDEIKNRESEETNRQITFGKVSLIRSAQNFSVLHLFAFQSLIACVTRHNQLLTKRENKVQHIVFVKS